MPARWMPSSRRRCGSWSRPRSRSSSRPWSKRVGKTTLLTALLDFLPPAVRTVELAGVDETFDWLPQASELGWTRPGGARRGAAGSAPIRPRRPSCSPMSCPTTCRPTPGAPRRGSRSGPRSIGYGLAATIHADTLEEVFDALRRPPVRLTTTSCRSSASCSSLRRARRRTAPGRRRPLRPSDVRDEHGHRPAAGARRPRDLGPERRTPSSSSAGASRPSCAMRVGRKAGDFELEVDRRRTTSRPRGGRHVDAAARPTAHRRVPPGQRLTLRWTDAQARASSPGTERSASRMPVAHDKPPPTLAELRARGWRSRTVKEELRANLLDRLAAGRPVFPGIVGYEETVLPAIENAILAGHDLVFLGERGQAKTRMARLAGRPARRVAAGRPRRRAQRRPVSRRSAPAARAIVERDGDDDARSTGCRATAATPRSSRRPTSRSPT